MSNNKKSLSFAKTGLPNHKAVKKAYVLASNTMKYIDGGVEYLNTCLDAAKLIQTLPDANEAQKIKWITMGYLSIADEFGGQKRTAPQSTIRDIAKNAGVSDEVLDTPPVNFDNEMEISGIPGDLKVLCAAGIVAAVPFYLNAKPSLESEKLSGMADRFNRHAAAIRKGEIPASLHKQMTESVARFNRQIGQLRP